MCSRRNIIVIRRCRNNNGVVFSLFYRCNNILYRSAYANDGFKHYLPALHCNYYFTYHYRVQRIIYLYKTDDGRLSIIISKGRNK